MLKFNGRVITSVVLFCLVFIVGSAFSDDEKFGKITDLDIAVGPPADYPEANAVVIFDKSNILVKKTKIIIDFHVRMKILNDAGVDEIGDQSIVYHDKYDKLKGFEAHTITPDGQKHKVEKNSIFEKSVDNFYKEKTFSFPALEAGAIVEYKYTINSENFWYLKKWYFQNTIYTMKSQVSVALSPGFAYDYIFNNVPSIYQKPEIEEMLDPSYTGPGINKIKKFIWTMENLPPVKDEPYMSSENDYRSSVKFQLVSFTYSDMSQTVFVGSWEDEGNDFQIYWLDDYINDKGNSKKLSLQLVSGLSDKREIAKTLFDYVKSNISTSSDYHNKFFKNDKLSQMVEMKSGTPEEKNLYLCELLKAAGIESWPVLISTRQNGSFNPKYPDTRQFNYIIVFAQFGQEWEFMDVSDRDAVFGILPPSCLTEGGFLIDGKQSSLVRITIKPLNSYRNDLTRIHITDGGEAVCTTMCDFGGYYASDYIDKFQDNNFDDFIQKYFRNKLDGNCVITDSSCVVDSAGQFVMDFCYSSNDLCRHLDENMMVKPVSLAYNENVFKSSKRFFPVDFTYPFVYENKVEIYQDQKLAEVHLPDDVITDIGGIVLSRKSDLKGSVIEITERLEVKKPLFDPTKYQQIKSLFEILARFSTDEIGLVVAPTETD